MIQNRPVHFLGSREVQYLWNGRKLSEYRRAQLRGLAKALKISPEGEKNTLLHRIISKLDAVGAERELSDITQMETERG